MAALIEQWQLMEVDFSTVYHLEIEDHLHRSWRWFVVKAYGLLGQPDSLLRRHFFPDSGGS